jgi:3-isopropylmalate/(R)-2-methylmalate dehydratase small subunit
MQPFHAHTGVVAPLARPDIDTDQIIPKQFLKRLGRTGYADALFYDWRTNGESFVLNDPRYAGASVLVGGPNFGCGSSREHAVWALEEYGFRCVIASSFADIFFSNCFKNGVLPIVLPEETVAALFAAVEEVEGYSLTVDLPEQCVVTPSGERHPFSIDAFRKHCLVNGLDDIGLTLAEREKIVAYETKRRETSPWLFAS